MSEDWASVAVEVEAAIKSIGTTDAGYVCTLRRPGTPTGPAYDPTPGTPSYFEFAVLSENEQIRDASGSLVGQKRRMLTVSGAAGVVPSKNDMIAVGVAEADIDANTLFEEIIDVDPLSPAGVAVLYELTLGLN